MIWLLGGVVVLLAVFRWAIHRSLRCPGALVRRK